jgi:hypothetical protein
MPSYALKRCTVFQVREQLTDEGEDHAWFNSNRRFLESLRTLDAQDWETEVLQSTRNFVTEPNLDKSELSDLRRIDCGRDPKLWP